MEGLVGAALWIDISELWECPCCGIRVELVHGLDVGHVGSRFSSPL